ncbi:hypothetical protein [Aneurinibacillus migulanus]|uniref:hypothetical protein n=1 Tax=Aneurinibacillus migulanus TaxID=47500 RepID=UPI0020A1FBF3|nr:hypothetical protein [Aneurinibacillus migulanus]MCP1355474.1 hypothetical protein [Aneurinibacillus migulanus]
MQFTKDSAVVQAWVRVIRNGGKSFEEVPALHNLREEVGKKLGYPTESEESV